MARKLLKKTTSIRFDPGLKADAMSAARKEGLGTLTAIVSVALIEYLRARGCRAGGMK